MSLTLQGAFEQMPLLAVLRGIYPDEAEPVGEALIEAGFTTLEVTLDSPEPFTSIERLARRFGDSVFVLAGTVLKPDAVSSVAQAGGRAIVAPNLNEAVVRETKRAGLLSMPGVLTPTEAFNALDYGADALKIFPGDAISPAVVKGMKAVLPAGTQICVTGGVTANNLGDFLTAGADAAGIGSALFKHGRPAAEIGAEARRLVEAVRGAR